MYRIKKYYCGFSEILFFVYLIGIMSFGRIFAINHIMVGKIPLFVTEMVIILLCPYVLINLPKLLELPKTFLITAGAFLSIGIFHLLTGLLSGNLFALRDAVLSVYMVFVLIAYLVFSKADNLKKFLKILIVANILAIALFKFYLFLVVYPSISDITSFFSSSNLAVLKGFNFGLYANIFIAFIFSFCGFVKNKINKILMIVLLSLNIYIIVSMDSRSSIIALLSNVIFFLLVLRGRYWRSMITYFLISLLFVGSFYYLDFCVSKIASDTNHGSRMTTVIKLVKSIDEGVISRDEGETIANTKSISIGGNQDCVNQCPEWTKKKSFLTDYMKRIIQDRNKTSDLSQNVAYSSAYWRLVVDVQAIDFGLEAPILGKGFGVYPDYRLAQNQEMTQINKENFALYSRVISPHNHIIAVFMKMGFVGLALFLFMNAYAFIFGLCSIRKCNNEFIRQYIYAVLGSLVSWHVLALLFDVIDAPMTNIFLWIFLGMIFAIAKYIDTNQFNKGQEHEINF